MQTIGVVGMGKIGMPIALNLLKGGYRVVGYRRSPTPEFESAGGVRAKSAAEVGAAADIILSCLPSVAALDETISGANGLLANGRRGQIIVELGSYDVADKARQLALLSAKGMHFIDGEVSGTPSMVVARKGVVFLAGDAEAVKSIEPVISAIAESQFYFGEFGAATKVKLINNVLVTLNVTAAAEAMALGMKAGVDVPTMIKAISGGSGASTMFNIRATWMAERKFLPAQGEVGQLKHYIHGAHAMAAELGCATPMLDRAAELFKLADAQGLSKHDVAAMVQVIEAVPFEKKKSSRPAWRLFGKS